MTRKWSESKDKVKFYSMHPGWADTPGTDTTTIIAGPFPSFLFVLVFTAVQQSMPDFHARLESKLRSPDEGADTVVWLAIVAQELTNGAFYQGDRVYFPIVLFTIFAYSKKVSLLFQFGIPS